MPQALHRFALIAVALALAPPLHAANRTAPPSGTAGTGATAAPGPQQPVPGAAPPQSGPPSAGHPTPPPPVPVPPDRASIPDDEDEDDVPPGRVVDWLFPLLRGLPPLPRPTISMPPARIIVGRPSSPSRTVASGRPSPGGPPRTPGNPPPPRATPAPTASVAGEVLDRVVLVALSGGSDRLIEAAIGADLGLSYEVAYESPVLGLRLVRFRVPATTSIGDALTALAQDADVVSAQPEFVFRAVGGAGAARQAAALPQYAAEKLRIAEAHAIAQGRNVRVAVIDTALDAAHPELEGAIAGSFNALGDAKALPEPHGTTIAGILAARAALRGVAPAAAVLAVSAFRASDGGAARSSTLALVKGIDWALAQRARVVNMSFAGPHDPLLGEAIAAATAKGLVFVAAAGNAGPGAPPAYPAAFPATIAVTATDADDRVYAQANRGGYVSVAAPGVDIMAPAPKGLYEMSSGTSMAAAHVSGVVALLLEREPELKPDDIRQILGQSARRPAGSSAKDLGAGIVDAASALERTK